RAAGSAGAARCDGERRLHAGISTSDVGEPDASQRMRHTAGSVRVIRPASAAGALHRPLGGFLDPRRLDRLENLLARAFWIVAELRQRTDPVVQIGEADRVRIDIRMRFRQRDYDFGNIGPLHLCPLSGGGPPAYDATLSALPWRS